MRMAQSMQEPRNWVLADVVAEVVRLLGESRITRQHDNLPALRPSDIGIVGEVELRRRALRIGLFELPVFRQ